jgi:hypothetical protein
VLYATGVLDSIPIPDVPADLKRRLHWKPAKRKGTLETPALGVLPNPASDLIAFTYADGLEAGVLDIHDAQGHLLRALPLSGGKGLLESNVRGLPNGLYTVRLVLEGRALAHTQFTVAR